MARDSGVTAPVSISVIEWARKAAERRKTMSAYFVVDLDVNDAVGFEEYRRVVPPVIQKYGGRFLVRGGAVDVIEGQWKPKRLTLIEFPNAARAKEFYNSPEYQKIIGLRLKAARTNLVLVEGV